MRTGSTPNRSALAPCLLVALSALGAPVFGCGNEHEAQFDSDQVSSDARSDTNIIVPRRTPHIATFPCVEQCHVDLEPNASPRDLTEFHSLKSIEHGDTTFWCNFCHNVENLDKLRLLDDRTITFDESHRLCGQCHGAKRRDWERGIHGLQTGNWNGERIRRNCPACHDPHAPLRPKFKALPAPRRPPGEHGASEHE